MAHFSVLCSNLLSYLDILTGMKGFEPLHVGSKFRRLTTWPHPSGGSPPRLPGGGEKLEDCFFIPGGGLYHREERRKWDLNPRHVEQEKGNPTPGWGFPFPPNRTCGFRHIRLSIRDGNWGAARAFSWKRPGQPPLEFPPYSPWAQACAPPVHLQISCPQARAARHPDNSCRDAATFDRIDNVGSLIRGPCSMHRGGNRKAPQCNILF